MSRIGKDIIKGLKQAIAYKKGLLTEKDGIVVHRFKVPERVDVKSIRNKLHMTQEEFSSFGFSISAIRHWENDRRKPEGAARVLLKVIEKSPQLVLEVLSKSNGSSLHSN